MLTVVDSRLFARLWPDYWSESSYEDFVHFLSGAPLAGDLIVGSGGCRKIRWGRTGSGKRGGVRVIYVLSRRCTEILLLTMYAKNELATLSPKTLAALAKELQT